MPVSLLCWALLPCVRAKICQALADPERSHPALFLHCPLPVFLLFSFLLSLFFPLSSSVQQGGQWVTPIIIQGKADRSISLSLLPSCPLQKCRNFIAGCQIGGESEDRELPRMGKGEEGAVLGGRSLLLMNLQLGAATLQGQVHLLSRISLSRVLETSQMGKRVMLPTQSLLQLSRCLKGLLIHAVIP